jgi:putative phage-type endonuclease
MTALKDRTRFIGGSDAAAVLGLSRWSTPLEVWALKTGQIEKKDEPTLAKTLGNRLEETVAELFTEKTGLKVRRVNETIFHRSYPFLGANIDRAVVGTKEGVECKTVSGWKAKEWAGEEIPQEYIIQCNHYLAVTGWKRWHLAVLIGNQDFIVKKIERDEALLKALISKEIVFWNEFVIPKTMPGTFTAKDSDTLYRLFPVADVGSSLELGDEGAQLAEERASLYQDVIQVEKRIGALESQIKALLGEKESATAGRWRISWRNQAQVRLDAERIKSEEPDLYRRFGKETKFRKLTIREDQNVDK